MLSAAPAPKSGLNTARDFLCSIREFSPGAVRRYYASTALTTAFFPIADMYLLLEHGDPKTARFFPGGHMGGRSTAGDLGLVERKS